MANERIRTAILRRKEQTKIKPIEKFNRTLSLNKKYYFTIKKYCEGQKIAMGDVFDDLMEAYIAELIELGELTADLSDVG